MKAERALLFSLLIAVLDTIYLSWRFVALEGQWVTPGTGLCSWTQGIDCDCVLQTPEARAFYVPNAILGLAFFAGCALWHLWGRRRPAPQQKLIMGLLSFWLGLGTLFTFYFYFLLVQLDCFCPFCPWNHLWTWIAFGAAVAIYRRTPSPPEPVSLLDLSPMIGACVGLFAVINATWLVFRGL